MRELRLPLMSWIVGLSYDIYTEADSMTNVWVEANLFSFLQWANENNTIIRCVFYCDKNLNNLVIRFVFYRNQNDFWLLTPYLLCVVVSYNASKHIVDSKASSAQNLPQYPIFNMDWWEAWACCRPISNYWKVKCYLFLVLFLFAKWEKFLITVI